MTKSPLSAYLDPKLLDQLEAYAARRRVSKSVVAEAAIASFLSPDSAERDEAVLVRRLDRLSRQVERLERDSTIGIEMMALFVRVWLFAAAELRMGSDKKQAVVRIARTDGAPAGRGSR